LEKAEVTMQLSFDEEGLINGFFVLRVIPRCTVFTVNLVPSGKDKYFIDGYRYGGIWYVGSALTFGEFCKRAKEYGFDGVELDNKRPMGCPLDLDKRRRDEMVNILIKNGLEIPTVAANNDFSSPVQEHRECMILSEQ
jgi:hypothetical protein